MHSSLSTSSLQNQCIYDGHFTETFSSMQHTCTHYTHRTHLIRDLFYFSIREFQISRLVEYSQLTRHSGVEDALNAWMLQLGRYHATRLWLGGGPWEVERWTGSCGGVKLLVQSAPVSLMYSCLIRPDRQTAVIPNSSHPVAVIAQQWTLLGLLTPSHAGRQQVDSRIDRR